MRPPGSGRVRRPRRGANTGGDAYGQYIARIKDDEAADAFAETTGGGRRMVLIVGESAAGKTRWPRRPSVREAARTRSLSSPALTVA